MPLPSPASRMLLADFPQQHVLRLTLHRPDARNAYNAQMVNELAQWLAWSEQESAIRTVILTGSGTVFCSGADLQQAFTGGGKGLRNSAGGWSPLQHLRWPLRRARRRPHPSARRRRRPRSSSSRRSTSPRRSSSLSSRCSSPRPQQGGSRRSRPRCSVAAGPRSSTP